jgi:hypothetical protein
LPAGEEIGKCQKIGVEERDSNSKNVYNGRYRSLSCQDEASATIVIAVTQVTNEFMVISITLDT